MLTTPKLRGRPKGSKNQTSTVSVAFDEPSPSFAPPVMTKTIKSDRAVKGMGAHLDITFVKKQAR